MAEHLAAIRKPSGNGEHKSIYELYIRDDVANTCVYVGKLERFKNKYDALSAGQKAEWDSASATLSAIDDIAYNTLTDIT